MTFPAFYDLKDPRLTSKTSNSWSHTPNYYQHQTHFFHWSFAEAHFFSNVEGLLFGNAIHNVYRLFDDSTGIFCSHLLDVHAALWASYQHWTLGTSRKTLIHNVNGWIKKRSHTQKSHPKVVNPRDIVGEPPPPPQKKKKKKKKLKVQLQAPGKQTHAGQGLINISVITETGESWEDWCAGVSCRAK